MSNKCMGPEKKRACQSIKMWLWKTKNYAWFPIMIKSLIFREFVKTASFVQDSWKEEISFVNSLKLKHTFVIRDSSIDKILFVKLLNPLFLCRSWIRENEKYRSWIRESSPPWGGLCYEGLVSQWVTMYISYPILSPPQHKFSSLSIHLLVIHYDES